MCLRRLMIIGSWTAAFSIQASCATFNVMDYGATGDGVTDDSKAVQAALNAVPSGGGTIIFPDGTYRLSLLTPRANTTIKSSLGAVLIAEKNLPNTLFNLYNGIVASTKLSHAIANDVQVTVGSTASFAVGHRVVVSGGTFRGSGVEEGPIEFNTVRAVHDANRLTLETPLKYSYSAFGLPDSAPRLATLGPAELIVRNVRITGGTYKPHPTFNSVYFLLHNVEDVEIDHIHFDGKGSTLMTGHNVRHLDFHDNVQRGRALAPGVAINLASLVESKIARNIFNTENEDGRFFQSNHLALEVACRDNVIDDNEFSPIRSTLTGAVEFTFYGFGNRISGNRIFGLGSDIVAGKPTLGIRTYAHGFDPAYPGNEIVGNVITDVMAGIGDMQAASRIEGNIIRNSSLHPGSTGLFVIESSVVSRENPKSNVLANVATPVKFKRAEVPAAAQSN